MHDRHAPSDEFTARLEARIGREVRQRNAAAQPSGWRPRLQTRALLAVAGLVLVSMAIGGGVVAAAYQAQNNEQRDLLVLRYQRRLDAAMALFDAENGRLRAVEQQRSVGLATEEAVLEARTKVQQAQFGVEALKSQMDEARLSAREPSSEVSAPLVSGRDFVSERLRIEMMVPRAGLDFEIARQRQIARRVEVGLANQTDVRESQARVMELQAGVELFERKLNIRQRFLKNEYDAAMADLSVIEAETEQRRKALLPKVDVAQAGVARAQAMVDRGLLAAAGLNEARVHVMELQLELAKLDADLAAVKKQIASRRGK